MRPSLRLAAEKLRTRLACVKHAASVRSEPGSNSHLKLVVPKIKNPGRAGARLSERTFCRSVHSSKTERVLALIIRLSKSGPPVQQVGLQAIREYSRALYKCQAFTGGFSTSHGGLPPATFAIKASRASGFSLPGECDMLAPRMAARRKSKF